MRFLVFSSWQSRRPGGLAALSEGKASCAIAGRPNPSVKGTSRKRAAPYVER
jgi:hypothetical protein